MGIFGQLPAGQTSGLCVTEAVVNRKAQKIQCREVPKINKDCRGHLLIGCDLRLFTVSDCGDVLFFSCDGIAQGQPALWVCEDCCPTDYSEVKALWPETGNPVSGYAKLSDGRIVKVTLLSGVVVEINCLPAVDQECLTCITTSGNDGEAVALHPHKPHLNPADYSINIAPLCP